MSAIGGVVDFRRGSIDFSAFNKMRNSVSMRGRAGSSAYLDVGVGIFNCSDGLSSCAQPIISERRGYVNAISLDSRSVDASLALERYRTSGVEFLSGLCGDFAIAVYDSERRMLLLARDKSGAKPLFFIARGGRVYFSSEVKGLLALQESSIRIDREYLSYHLTSSTGVYRASDLYYGVSEVEAGECVLFTELGFSRFFYQTSMQGKKSNKEKVAEKELFSLRGLAKIDEVLIKNSLSDTLVAFDMPQFDAFLPRLCAIFELASEASKKVFKYEDEMKARGARYAYEREDRLSSFYGVVGIGEYCSRELRNSNEKCFELCEIYEILLNLFFELDSSDTAFLRSIFGERKSECVWRFVDSKNIKKEDTEFKIRILGMLCQTVEWFRLWNLDFSKNDKIYSI